MVFADNSGSTNGLAMKPWEISGKAEHVALEINNNGIFLWHYNKGNEYPNASQLGVNNATVNYIDGNDHVIKVEYKAEESAYKLKLTIDEAVHYDNTLTTSKLFVNNVLTLGGYGNNKIRNGRKTRRRTHARHRRKQPFGQSGQVDGIRKRNA